MISSLSGFTQPLPMPSTTGLPTQSASEATPFDQLLAQSLGEVNSLSAASQQQIQNSLVGEDISLVESLTAFREADLALKLMMQVRNKLLEGYQELQRMQM